MKLLYLTPLYPAYLRAFYAARPELASAPYQEQLAAFDRHAFAWVGAWPHALAPLGVEAREILSNVPRLQQAWAAENAPALAADGADLRRIAIAQAAAFRPDVLFFDSVDRALLRGIREAVPGLRLAVGWSGSAIPETDVWGDLDLILSCAPESVDWLRSRGYRAQHLHHAFNDQVLPRIQQRPKRYDIAFFGHILTHSAIHRSREVALEGLVDSGVQLEIFSPSHELGWREDWQALKKIGAWHAARAAGAAGVPAGALARLPWIGPAMSWEHKPVRPVSPKLRPRLKPALFGLDMYQAVADSVGVLNIHADSSTTFASNMRLFETTGAGGCLLTDWKENLKDLFEPDREVVTYRSAQELAEKARWLVDHPAEAAAIGRAAQARACSAHGFSQRAKELRAIVAAAMA
jgi:hypothetical protein